MNSNKTAIMDIAKAPVSNRFPASHPIHIARALEAARHDGDAAQVEFLQETLAACND